MTLASVVILFLSSIGAWCVVVRASEEVFPIHPYTDHILKELRQQGRIYGARWLTALATLTTACHPMDASGLTHTALSLVNLRREFLSASVIRCDPNIDISSCAAIDNLDNASLKDLVEIFVKLQAICTTVAHGQRSGASQKVVDMASDLNGEILTELSALKSALRRHAESVHTEDPVRAMPDTAENHRGDPSRPTPPPLPAPPSAASLTDMFSMVASLANDASKAIKELMNKGSYYLCISYMVITYVTLLMASHWLTCRLLRGARQACFLIAFSNCIVHIWLLRKSYCRTRDHIDIAWLTPNLTDSTLLHCVVLVIILAFTAIRRYDTRLKYLHHIDLQHRQIRQVIQGLDRAGRLRAA